MEYKFNEEVKKAMRRQGGESNDIVQSIAKDAYKKGYEGLQEGIFVGSVEMKGLQDSFTEVFIAYSDTQAEQTRIANMVNDDARKLFSSMYVSPNYLRTAETLPIPTIEGLRKANFFHVNGKEISA